jgi:hypothetical protein
MSEIDKRISSKKYVSLSSSATTTKDAPKVL